MDPAVETVLMGGYAVGLVMVALGLDLLGRPVRASREQRPGGFRYHPEEDLWVCPTGQPMWPHSVDTEARVVRYRTEMAVCKACPERHDCTASATGREVSRTLDPWPHSEAGRFHRAIALALLAVAALFLGGAAIRVPQPDDLLVLGAIGLLWALSAWLLTAHLRHTPAELPAGVPAASR
ncbi:hypothetical protein [Nocardia sp. NPDC051832]|uniref:hypothetical protein n=1 Tax=Nocardia sp. NPDC051832 TaxID=3155673 RepID=UPI00343C9D55